jgi:hypothetical protein
MQARANLRQLNNFSGEFDGASPQYTLAMVSSRTEDGLLATQWIAHFESTWAWDELNEVIEREPERGWRLIKAMVAYAPDYVTLCAVAAGPVEDLLQSAEWLARAVAEAEADARLRLCLRATYLDLPAEVSEGIGRTEGHLPAATDPPVLEPDELKLIFGWFHHHDTHASSTLVKGIIDRDPERAAALIEFLFRLADDHPGVADDVLLFAFAPFARKHLGVRRDLLMRLATNNTAVRDWVTSQRRAVTDDEEAWQEFVRDVASV